MTTIGQGQKYDAIIRGEISQLIREMEKIDFQRDLELQSRLGKAKRQNPKIIWKNLNLPIFVLNKVYF